MNEHYPFVNPPLPYAYDALEPCIDALTMCLHHDRHLQTYVNNLNETLKDCPDLHDWSLERLLCNVDCLKKDIRRSIRNNGGGVFNHIFYFNGISNSETRCQAGKLYDAIVTEFGCVEAFFYEFKEKALSVFGSGYAWLTVDQDCKLQIITTANQDTPIVQNLCPVLTIDVWEHAYYLMHYNDREAYIQNWFNVVDWECANMHYMECLECFECNKCRN
ncbi:superoxide dismutase [Lacrimispora sphenoides]|uniref:Superoxide dismutase n=1 Tax=Lacrimispora sphenoides JCM 1415 TaxID=1297793 RepID=A0ABY1C315_9FIRM|nr:superoxide dismutase [Lacrimispora sphenoides]SET59029.1 superoxide dismutase, Fe-Mn family [[Clostridium] sphenoides JCM 1415]SUY49934.1 Superoxide dismutase [Lacrimispora sphenoides]